ncbi:hypothetical protein ABI59_22920 [Acidobacteria bacterium Mor1]|nr:hypothetical protein ABI59_22920 [Acidobacteria bacterium Mor1]
MPDETSHGNSTLDLTVIGAGISGLVLARDVIAARPEWNVTLLEAAESPGGTMRSERVDGCLCEWGPNGFLTNVPDTWDLAHELGLAERVRVADDRAKKRFLFLRGRMRELSTSPLGFLGSGVLSLGGCLRILAEPFAGRSAEPDESIFDFAARRIGPEAADVLVRAMVTGIFAGDPRKLSLRAALPRMAAMEDRHRSLVKAMFARKREAAAAGRESGGPGGPGGRLVTFDEGMQVLVDRLAEGLGPRLRTGTPVQQVRPDQHGFVVSAPGGELRTRRLVLAIPSFAAAGLMGRELGAVASEVESIPYAGVNVVCLVYDRDSPGRPLDGFGYLVPDSRDARHLGCIWTGSVFPDHVPGDRVLLRAMAGGIRDPEAVAMDDDALTGMVHEELARTHGGMKRPPREARIFRWPKAIPQYPVGHLERMQRIDAALAATPGLYVAGNAYRGVAVNDCVREARLLAKRILAG